MFGLLSQPRALAIDGAGNVIVSTSDRIVLTKEGALITEWPLEYADCIAVDCDGRLLVGDSRRNLHVFAFPA